MSVAAHLRIELDDYDRKIRTFVPHYDMLIDATARALTLLHTDAPAIVDLGIGTGALSQACLAVRPAARIIGIDMDPGMLDAARTRLAGHGNLELHQGSFLEGDLPRADALVACIALHHIGSPAIKQSLYRRAFESLAPGGILVSGDCFPARDPRLAAQHHEAWLNHLEQTYTRSEAEGYLEAWSGEDTYFPLHDELRWLQSSGFVPEVLWRRDGFAVMAGMRPL